MSSLPVHHLIQLFHDAEDFAPGGYYYNPQDVISLLAELTAQTIAAPPPETPPMPLLRAAPSRPPILHTFTSPPSPFSPPTLSSFLSHWLYCACRVPTDNQSTYPSESFPPSYHLDTLYNVLSSCQANLSAPAGYVSNARTAARDANIRTQVSRFTSELVSLRTLLAQMDRENLDPGALLLNHYLPPPTPTPSTRTITTSATFDEMLSDLTQLHSQGIITSITGTSISFLIPACSFRDRNDVPPLTLGPWLATLTPTPVPPSSSPGVHADHRWWNWLRITRADGWLAPSLPPYVVHPHINSGGLHCWGEAQRTLPPTLRDPNPSSLYGILCSWASTYNGESPYQTLSSIRSLLFPSSPLLPFLLVPTVDPNHVPPAPLPDQLSPQTTPGVPHGPSPQPPTSPRTLPTTPPSLLRPLPTDAEAPPALLRPLFPLPELDPPPDSDPDDDDTGYESDDVYDEDAAHEEPEETEEVIVGTPLQSPPPGPEERAERAARAAEVQAALNVPTQLSLREPLNAPITIRQPSRRSIPNYPPSDIPF